MPLLFVCFLPSALAVGWFGARTAFHIRHAKGSRADELFMAALCWSPLAIWLVALLLFRSGWSR
jgi:hypothetical protein